MIIICLGENCVNLQQQNFFLLHFYLYSLCSEVSFHSSYVVKQPFTISVLMDICFLDCTFVSYLHYQPTMYCYIEKTHLLLPTYI